MPVTCYVRNSTIIKAFFVIENKNWDNKYINVCRNLSDSIPNFKHWRKIIFLPFQRYSTTLKTLLFHRCLRIFAPISQKFSLLLYTFPSLFSHFSSWFVFSPNLLQWHVVSVLFWWSSRFKKLMCTKISPWRILGTLTQKRLAETIILVVIY